jgi:hypothetical protein
MTMAEGGSMKDQQSISGIVDFLKGRDDVASVYVFGLRKGEKDEARELGIGVLMDERCLDTGDEDSLDMGGWDISDDFSFSRWPVSVVLLNSAPVFLQHHVVRKGSVVFERNARQRLRFAEQAINTYLDQLPDDHFRYEHEPMLELTYEEYGEMEEG